MIFYFLYLFRKICSKCKLRFLAKNLRKSLALNGLRLVWSILDKKKHTSIVVYCQQVFVVDNFKRPFWVHVSHKISKFIIIFSLPCLYTKVNRLPTCLQIWFSDGEIIEPCNSSSKLLKSTKRVLWYWIRPPLKVHLGIRPFTAPL